MMMKHNDWPSLLLATLSLYLATTSITTTTSSVMALSSSKPPTQFYGGAGIGRFVVEDYQPEQWSCHYDMVLVERIQGKPRTASGLYVPQEDLPKLHLCRVLSLGPGREEENGFTAPMPHVAVGDVIWAKNPWGIGPKDEETADGRKISFMRSQDIAAVVTGGLLDDDDNDVNADDNTLTTP